MDCCACKEAGRGSKADYDLDSCVENDTQVDFAGDKCADFFGNTFWCRMDDALDGSFKTEECCACQQLWFRNDYFGSD